MSATCPAVKPLHPTTPPDGWPTLELLFSARIAETTLDFEEKKVISNYGQIRKLLIFAILEIFGYRRCGRARSGRLRGDRSRLRCCGDSATSLTEKTLLRSRTEGPTAPLRARRHLFCCVFQWKTRRTFLPTCQLFY